MIRWYDWIAAIIAADLLLTFFVSAFTQEIWYMSMIESIIVYFIWDMWKAYCEWRKRSEIKR